MKSPTIQTLKRTVPYLRIDTAGINVKVESGGAVWAGRSEVPAAQFSAQQLVELNNDKRLSVTEIDRDAEPEAGETAEA